MAAICRIENGNSAPWQKLGQCLCFGKLRSLRENVGKHDDGGNQDNRKDTGDPNTDRDQTVPRGFSGVGCSMLPYL